MSKAKKCKVGFPCGKSCISRLRKCWNNLPKEGENKQFETFSQFVNRIVGAGNDKESAIKNDTPAAKSKKAPELPKFDINQKLTRDKHIGEGYFGAVYDFGDIVVKSGQIEPDEKEILKHLTNNNFKSAPKFIAESFDGGVDRIAMSKAPGDILFNQLGSILDDEDRQIILDSVKELHKLNVAHRDLHGANIMYDKATKQPTIIDYGLARLIDPKKINTFDKTAIIDDGISIQNGVGKYSPEKIQRINTLLGTSNTQQILKNKSNDNWLELMNNKEKFDKLMEELYTL